jgi:hypothetical protein
MKPVSFKRIDHISLTVLDPFGNQLELVQYL